MLTNPTHAVVGCSSLEATARLLAAFGFALERRGFLEEPAARALYGLERETAEWLLAVPGAATGWLRLVETPHAARVASAFDPRAFALDLFTREIGKSLEIAAGAGYSFSKVAEHRFGPMTVREAEVHGPDQLVLTLLGLDKRRPSVLDSRLEALHSEVHSFVYSVHGADPCVSFWQQAGLQKVADAMFGGTTLSIALGLPEREIQARFVVFSDARDQPVRVQLIEFLGEGGTPVPDWPLAGGLFALGFEVGDLESAMAGLSSARFEGPVSLSTGVLGSARAVSAAGPAGMRFELWQTG